MQKKYCFYLDCLIFDFHSFSYDNNIQSFNSCFSKTTHSYETFHPIEFSEPSKKLTHIYTSEV